MIRRFHQINDNLYRGSAPNEQDVQALYDIGVRKIVSLDQKTGDKINNICKNLGIQHIIIPINVRDLQSLKLLVSNNIYNLLMKDGPTFVHCLHGKDRTGLVIAMFKVRYEGMDPKEAIKEAKSMGFGFFIPPETKKIYENLIKKSKKSSDSNNAQDAVGASRDESAFGMGFPDTQNQTTFSPPTDATVNYDGAMAGRYSDSDNSGNVNPINEFVNNSIPEVGQYVGNVGNALNGMSPFTSQLGQEWV